MQIIVELKADMPSGQLLRRIAVDIGDEFTMQEAADDLMERLKATGLRITFPYRYSLNGVGRLERKAEQPQEPQPKGNES